MVESELLTNTNGAKMGGGNTQVNQTSTNNVEFSSVEFDSSGQLSSQREHNNHQAHGAGGGDQSDKLLSGGTLIGMSADSSSRRGGIGGGPRYRLGSDAAQHM